MRISSENNANVQEESSLTEYIKTQENASTIELVQQKKEFDSSKEFIEKESEKPRTLPKKTQNQMTAITTSFVAVAVVGFIGFTNLINVNLKAEFTSIQFEDGVIKYDIAIENRGEEQMVIDLLTVDNQPLARHIIDDPTVENEMKGTFPIDIQWIENQLETADVVTCYATLKGNVGLNVERTFDRYAIEISSMQSYFDRVEGYCNCTQDGYFYFQMHFQDDYGAFEEFTAYIVDKKGNRFDCKFNANLHDEQRIAVGTAAGGEATLWIQYLADSDLQEIQFPIQL